MGGDGGTLNNSRREHVRLRNRILGAPLDATTSSARRASITECALSKARLSPPHVVVDRAGNLYNKEALLSYLLARRSRENGHASDAFAHIHSVKRDTAPVRFLDGETQLSCPVTRKIAFEEGGFTVGWNCGCVTAPVQHVKGVGGTDENGDKRCIACETRGPRVPLGATLADRQKLLEERRETEISMKRKKKRKAEQGKTINTVLSNDERFAEALRQDSPVRKIPRMAADAVYVSRTMI